MKTNYKFVNVLIILFEIILCLVGGFLFYKLDHLHTKSNQASTDRFKMVQLADKLRHSSDDLTHFARTYAVTGNTQYKEQFLEVLAIRNGDAARPKNYNGIYWDLDKQTREEKHPREEKVSLKALMNQLPYTKEERDLLALSEQNSNDLVNLEIEAFNALEGKFKDAKGNYTIIKEPNQQKAVALLHSQAYYDAKNSIMKPIDEFITKLDERTQAHIINLEKSINDYYFVLIVITILFIVGNLIIYMILSRSEKMNKQYLHDEIKRQLKQIRASDMIILEQSKSAQMGDMIGNIAHQWRQPLSAISSIASSMRVQKELGCITVDEEHNMLNNIIRNVNFLSKTIDTFRNYIKEQKEEKEVVLQDRIHNALQIILPTLKSKHIELINEIDKHEPVELTMIIGELSQVVINIMNNAKDALLDNKIQKPHIKIDLIVKENSVCVCIEDNAGGIPQEHLSRIFDPYFTTKHQTHGTGLGLYMSKEMVHTHLNGKLYVKNTDKGAKFFIEIPLR